MNKENLKILMCQSEIEKNIKNVLLRKSKYNNIYNVYLYLTNKKSLLQDVYKINDIAFYNILLKNYILSSNSTDSKISTSEYKKTDQIILNKFNNFIEDNSLYDAINLIENNLIIFNYLCVSYIRNLHETNNSLIDKIPENRIKNIYNKILILNQIEIDTNKINHLKKYKLIFK